MKITRNDIIAPLSQVLTLTPAMVIATLIQHLVSGHPLPPYIWIPGPAALSVLIGWYAAHLWWSGEHKRRRQQACAEWKQEIMAASVRGPR
jgi:hypothetical protein